ncbi:unnamed protein product [Gemmata massiliana]|uniref:Uncharacterized protein n=1 Tax=Gemmata massiliana TaxID=1210884 RepID=A0A6P2D0E5_9BACT|nr:unnamed protein product [Gemmata massiliana]
MTPLGKVKQAEFGFVGVRKRLNWPSVLMGYLRAGLGFGLFMFGTSAAVLGYEAGNGLGTSPKSAAVAARVAVSCGRGFWFSRWLTRADLASGNDLREDLGLLRSDGFAAPTDLRRSEPIVPSFRTPTCARSR